MRRVQRWFMVTALWLIWGLFQSSRLRYEVPDIDWATALGFGMPDAVIWALLTPLVVALARHVPVQARRVAPALAIHLAAALALALLHSGLDMLWNLQVSGLSGVRLDPGRLFKHLVKHGFHWNVVLYAAIVGITQYRQAERRAMELRARLSEARLDTLRAQLRPHFLFNTLHTISGLMERDVRKGRRMIRRLADLLRASLRPREHHEISLDEELDLVRAYLEIEQARFGSRLRVDLDVEPSALSCAVPALVLQPLVENAVRHGVEPKARGGTIGIRARRSGVWLEITLTDDGAGLREMPAPGNREGAAPGGIGLANTRDRLRELYGSSASLSIEGRPEGGVRVDLRLPARDAVCPARSITA